MSTIFELQEYALDGYRFVLNMPVRFQDVDGMGHVNNVSYFAFVETARIEYAIHIMDMHHVANLNNMPFILGGQSINYRTPAFFRERLLVGVRTNWVKRSSFGFEFEMREENTKRLVADGGGTHIMYDYEAQRSIPVSDEWLARLEGYEGRKLRNEAEKR